MKRDRANIPVRTAALALAVCVCAVLHSGAALAFSEVSYTEFYDIKGRTVQQLKDAMARNGPHGYWAYTTWYVRWSGACKVSVDVNYTMPHWADRSAAEPSLRQSWDRMIENLWLHEKGHAEHGLKAAQEIEADKCAGDPKAITQKWARQDEVYDKETDHGVMQGVHLP